MRERRLLFLFPFIEDLLREAPHRIRRDDNILFLVVGRVQRLTG
jgi:hypothetical protein